MCQRSHVTELALIGRHTKRGVALQMLNRAIAFAPSQIDVSSGNIVLEIDEARLGLGERHNGGNNQRHLTRRRANADHILKRIAWHKGLNIFAPIELASSLAVEMHHRREAARHGEQISVKAPRSPTYQGLDR